MVVFFAAVVFEVLFHRAGCDDGFARFIVDDLRLDVAHGTIDIQTGPLRRANDISAGTDMTFLTFCVLVCFVKQEVSLPS